MNRMHPINQQSDQLAHTVTGGYAGIVLRSQLAHSSDSICTRLNAFAHFADSMMPLDSAFAQLEIGNLFFEFTPDQKSF
jgi:hypothetical protein